MIKIIFTSFVLLSLCFFTIASAQEIDERLLPYFGIEELQTMKKEEPENYQFLLNALDKAIFIAEIPTQKEPVEFDGILEIDPTDSHNFLSLGLEILDRYQYFLIKDTNMMVVVLPKIFLTSK